MGYSHGKRWTDELVKEEILKVMKKLRIQRMPSRSEMVKATGNESLANRVAKTYGFYAWAQKLGLEIKDSETALGKKCERVIAKLLAEKRFTVEQMPQNYPYDLLVNRSIKVDVKSAKPFQTRDGYTYHTFNLEKRNPTCDIYILCLMDRRETIKQIMIIPSKNLNQTQVSVGHNSQYDKYIDRWDYLETFDHFYKQLG